MTAAAVRPSAFAETVIGPVCPCLARTMANAKPLKALRLLERKDIIPAKTILELSFFLSPKRSAVEQQLGLVARSEYVHRSDLSHPLQLGCGPASLRSVIFDDVGDVRRKARRPATAWRRIGS